MKLSRFGGGKWSLLLLLACSGSETQETPPSDLESATPEMPLTLADVAEGDTAAILNLMRHTMAEGDAALPTLERRDTIREVAGQASPQLLSLWLASETPVKLVVTAPNDPGRIPGEVSVWFVNGDVQVVQEPFAAFFVEADRIVLWTDPSLMPHEVSDADRMPREKMVIDSVKSWLRAFGKDYP
jgi:hypothetical protein